MNKSFIALVSLIILGIFTWVVYMQAPLSDPYSNDEYSESTDSVGMVDEITSHDSNSSFLPIEEWGIEIALPPQIPDLFIQFDSPGVEKTWPLSSYKIQNLNKENSSPEYSFCESGTSGMIVREANGNAIPGYYTPPYVYELGDYKFYYTPGNPCSTVPDVAKVIEEQVSILNTWFSEPGHIRLLLQNDKAINSQSYWSTFESNYGKYRIKYPVDYSAPEEFAWGSHGNNNNNPAFTEAVTFKGGNVSFLVATGDRCTEWMFNTDYKSDGVQMVNGITWEYSLNSNPLNPDRFIQYRTTYDSKVYCIEFDREKRTTQILNTFSPLQ